RGGRTGVRRRQISPSRTPPRRSPANVVAVAMRAMRLRESGRAALTPNLVVELHLPAPFLAVVGVPPGLQDSGLAPGQEHHPPKVLLRRPPVLQHDARPMPDQEAHRPRLMALQTITPGDHLAGRIGHDDLESLRRGMDQEPVASVIGVDSGAGEGEARRAGTGKPEVPGFKPTGHEEVVTLFVSRRN